MAVLCCVSQYAVIIALIILVQIVGAILVGVFYSKVMNVVLFCKADLACVTCSTHRSSVSGSNANTGCQQNRTMRVRVSLHIVEGCILKLLIASPAHLPWEYVWLCLSVCVCLYACLCLSCSCCNLKTLTGNSVHLHSI